MIRSAIFVLSVCLLTSCGSDSKNSLSSSGSGISTDYTLSTPDFGYAAYKLGDLAWKKTRGSVSLGTLSEETILEVACFDQGSDRNDYYSVTRMLLKPSNGNALIKPCGFSTFSAVTVTYENKSQDVEIVDIRTDRLPSFKQFPIKESVFTESINKDTRKFLVSGKKNNEYYYSKISIDDLNDGDVISIDFYDPKVSGKGIKVEKEIAAKRIYMADYLSPLERLFTFLNGRPTDKRGVVFKLPENLRYGQDFYMERWLVDSKVNQISFSKVVKDINSSSDVHPIEGLTPVRLTIDKGYYEVNTRDDAGHSYNKKSVSFYIEDNHKRINVRYDNSVNLDGKIQLTDFRLLPDFPHTESATSFSPGTKYNVNKSYQTSGGMTKIGDRSISKNYRGNL